MKPKAGHGYLETAAHFAAESSTGTNVEVVTTDDFTKGIDALVYYIDEAKRADTKIAYPLELVRPQHHRRPRDDRLLPDAGHRQQPGHGRHRARQDVSTSTCRPRCSSCSTARPRHQRPVAHAGPPGGGRRLSSSAPSSSRSSACARALRQAPAYDFWLGGDFIKNDEPQGNQVFAPLKETVIRGARRHGERARTKTGQAKLFSHEHHRRLPRRDVRSRRVHPGNLRRERRPRRLPGRRLSLPAPAAVTTCPPPLPQTSICTTTAPATARLPRRSPSAATPPSCWPRWRVCKALPASTSAPWATARWKAMATTGSSPT